MSSLDEAARVYLQEAIERADPPLTMADLSRAVGRNHAYIQQYIRTGKPRWLPEPVREAIVGLLRINGDPLKPPALEPLAPASDKRARTKSGDQAQVNAPRYGQFIDDPGTLELIELWNRITDPRNRELTKRILRTMADNSSAIVA